MENSLSSENQDFRMEYLECHIGSTFVGSVLRRRLRAERDINCVVPDGDRTLVFGSASKE